MTNGLAAIDNKLEKMKIGENSHQEYKWSNEIKERILQFSFQLTENGGENINELNNLKLEYSSIIEYCLSEKRNNYLLILYKLIAQTRDIINGKGIYSLSYMMIGVWANIGENNEKYKELGHKLAGLAIENCITESNGNHPLGSWKDIKYFLNYFKNEYNLDENTIENHPVFLHLLNIVINQLKKDETSLNPSLLARWIPREKSNKFGWISPLLAYKFFDNYIITAKTDNQLYAAQNKALMHFRKIITNINKKLKTVQVNQCARDWKSINFDKNLTSITLRKQSIAFQDRDKKGNKRIHNDEFDMEDRNECSKNYEKYIMDCHEGKKIIKSKNISIIDLVRDAIKLKNYEYNELEKMALNLQWDEQCKSTPNLENMIAMVDTSGSMECDNFKPLYTAIGLGLRVAEKSKFGKRILTFSQNPEWVNLEDCKDFIDSVNKIRKSTWGMNTNFYSACDLILKTAIENDIEPNELKNTTLVIFSDMQIDEGNNTNDSQNSLFDAIKEKYSNAGKKSKYKIPYPVPHIIFWNLRTTSGFPSLSSRPNTSMISGSSSNLLNLFLDKGSNILEEITPWKLLEDSLNNSRYLEFQTAFSINYIYNITY